MFDKLSKQQKDAIFDKTAGDADVEPPAKKRRLWKFKFFHHDKVVIVSGILVQMTKVGKAAKKGQNDKVPATPVTVPTYWKSVAKSYLEMGPMAKRAIFGQKGTKKCHFAIHLVR